MFHSRNYLRAAIVKARQTLGGRSQGRASADARYLQFDLFANQSGAIRSARKLLPLIFESAPAHTVVDVGCGIGAWAKVAKEMGCAVTGLDGDWVPQEQLLIDRDEFIRVDLANPPQTLGKRFDLALSLEVAEHLPETSAERFVRFVTGLAPSWCSRPQCPAREARITSTNNILATGRAGSSSAIMCPST